MRNIVLGRVDPARLSNRTPPRRRSVPSRVLPATIKKNRCCFALADIIGLINAPKPRIPVFHLEKCWQTNGNNSASNGRRKISHDAIVAGTLPKSCKAFLAPLWTLWSKVQPEMALFCTVVRWSGLRMHSRRSINSFSQNLALVDFHY